MEITPELLREIEHGAELTEAEIKMIYNYLHQLARNNDPRMVRASIHNGYEGIFHGRCLTVGTYGNGKKFKAVVRPVMKVEECPPVSSRWEMDEPTTAQEDYGLMGTR